MNISKKDLAPSNIYTGIIHLAYSQNFLKSFPFLPPDVRMFVWVSGGKKC